MATGTEMQQNAFSVAAHDRSLLCPKPRRLFSASAMRSFRLISDPQAESSDANPGFDLLDMLLSKEAGEAIEHPDPAPAPAFFLGSPPPRSDNPVAHDSRFGEADPLEPMPAAPAEFGSGFSCAPARVRYDLAPAAVRVEGFDCLDRESGRKIPAAA